MPESMPSANDNSLKENIMTTLHVKTDQDGNVIEACPLPIEGGQAVEATDQQIYDIIELRKDAVVTNGVVSSTSMGDDYTARQALETYRSTVYLEN